MALICHPVLISPLPSPLRSKITTKQRLASAHESRLVLRVRAVEETACAASGTKSAGAPYKELLRRAGSIAAGAALAAAIVLASPSDSLAYIGGGPYGREVTRGQDLTGKDYSGLDLTGQDFKTSILRQANFKGARLVGASFFDSDLTGADMSDADLTGADLSLANAFKVDFTNSVLEGISVTGNTSFKGAIIKNADFTDVLLRQDVKATLCKVAEGTNPVTGNDTRDTLFC